MIQLLNGLGIIIGFITSLIIIIYILGIIPNLWSCNIIRWDSFDDIASRGSKNLFFLVTGILVLVIAYFLGGNVNLEW